MELLPNFSQLEELIYGTDILNAVKPLECRLPIVGSYGPILGCHSKQLKQRNARHTLNIRLRLF